MGTPLITTTTMPVEPKVSIKPQPTRMMNSTRLSQIWSSLDAAGFTDEQLNILRKTAQEDRLSVEQAEILINTLSYDKDRAEAIIILFPSLSDSERVSRLFELVSGKYRADLQRRIRSLRTIRRP